MNGIDEKGMAIPRGGRRIIGCIVDKDKVGCRFTFTERELWVRKPFTPRIVPYPGCQTRRSTEWRPRRSGLALGSQWRSTIGELVVRVKAHPT